MIYVLTPQEFEEADELSYDELGEWMKNYWNSKDPTPETKLNEIQVEFFHRVDEANRKYSQRFTEGWETDRGKSLILYGEPDSVEANPYAVNSKPYEIWYYDKIDTKLTFIDQYKEDSYKLVLIESIKGIDE
jgi:GWxTD domain-containing protein